jgi:hypothetical protein
VEGVDAFRVGDGFVGRGDAGGGGEGGDLVHGDGGQKLKSYFRSDLSSSLVDKSGLQWA